MIKTKEKMKRLKIKEGSIVKFLDDDGVECIGKVNMIITEIEEAVIGMQNDEIEFEVPFKDIEVISNPEKYTVIYGTVSEPVSLNLFRSYSIDKIAKMALKFLNSLPYLEEDEKNLYLEEIKKFKENKTSLTIDYKFEDDMHFFFKCAKTTSMKDFNNFVKDTKSLQD